MAEETENELKELNKLSEPKNQYPKEIDFKPIAKILEMTFRENRSPAFSTWDGNFTTEVTKFNRISLCTTVMNRLKDVKQTIPKNMSDNSDYENSEFLILDYNSSDGLEDWVRKALSEHIKSGKVVFFRTTDPKFFDMSHSRNLAFKLATGDIVNNVDADAYTNEGFITFINKLANEQPEKAMFAKSKQLLRGRLGFYRKEFIELLGGYDEDLTGYGHDDADLMNRAWELGFRMMPFRGPFSGCTSDHVKHQSGNYRELWWKTEGRNRFLSYAKILLGQWKANEGRPWGVAEIHKMDPETGKMIKWDIPGPRLDVPKSVDPIKPEEPKNITI